jgi:hypothetical protein
VFLLAKTEWCDVDAIWSPLLDNKQFQYQDLVLKTNQERCWRVALDGTIIASSGTYFFQSSTLKPYPEIPSTVIKGPVMSQKCSLFCHHQAEKERYLLCILGRVNTYHDGALSSVWLQYQRSGNGRQKINTKEVREGRFNMGHFVGLPLAGKFCTINLDESRQVITFIDFENMRTQEMS